MKKIKMINKLLSSLTLLSPLSGIWFNNQYQNAQKVTIKNNNEINNFFSSSVKAVQMGDIYVNLDDTGKIIESYSSGSGTLIIPDFITQIQDNAFEQNKKIKSLDLSQATSLTTIGESAFNSCLNLLGDLYIPRSVSSIGTLAFYKTNFWSIKLDQNNQNYSLATNLGLNAKVLIAGTEGIWKDNSNVIGSLALGEIAIPNNITKISQNAFACSNINNLNLFNATSLTTIEDYAFSFCESLDGNIHIPSSLTTIARHAFGLNSITSIEIDPANQSFSLATNLGSESYVLVEKGSETWNNNSVAVGRLACGKIQIPSSIETIAEEAFEATSITEINFSQATNLTEIKQASFDSCLHINSLDISKAINLTTIDNQAFFGCLNLQGEIFIPSGLSSIGTNAFGLNNFSKISIDSSNQFYSLATNLGSKAHVLISGSEGKWNNTSTVIGALGYGEINIPKEISQIADNSFSYTNITSLDLSKATNLTKIGQRAFANNRNLKNDIFIPKNVALVDMQSFQNTEVDNLIFLSETPPTFGASWQPTLSGKVYVPSEQTKQAYLSAQNFNFSNEQISIGAPSKINVYFWIILASAIVGGVIIIFIIWSLTKKKKNNS